VTVQKNSTPLILLQAIFYPLIGFSQTFIPSQILYSLSEKVANYAFFRALFHIPYPLDYLGLVKSTDYISILLSLILIAVFLTFAYKKKTIRHTIIVGLILTVASFVPLAVLFRGNTSYFESRYYYVAVSGASILFSLFIYELLSSCLHRVTFIRCVLASICVIFVAGYFYKNISLTRAVLLQQNIEADERREIIQKLYSYFPAPPKNSVFYVTGDSLGYYGIPNQKIPFQQGTGYTLMVLYYHKDIIPRQLLREAFLWNIEEEGYKSVQDNGFGYFSSYEVMKNNLSKSKIPVDQVQAVYWDSSKHQLRNITTDVRKKLLSDFNDQTQ
jgi:hypothetical protein